ncbi:MULTISPECIES: lycopene cyclase family protein [Streptomyces]|uniref:Lycopene cyclase n=1 Tax=Streptomyces siderophoricus TaxID=2802281 RepID=A0ABS1MJE9_9ACTN|nr:lycopene cyclase family protein [Streptomyces sp. 9-7]MBL1088093.1 lycopene cyclase [Streptomyces sp. 9-7]
MRDADVVIVGAGAAGLSLAYRLCDAPGTGARRPTVVLVDAPPGPRRPPERTWCFWEAPGGEFDRALTAGWDALRVYGPDGTERVGRPAPLRYKMLRSGDFAAAVEARLAGNPAVRRAEATVVAVCDTGDGAEVRGCDAAGHPLTLRARWAFDSRPGQLLPPARTTLRQHFRGWFVRTRRAVFDPEVADWMDFRVPQPAHGLAFGYVLPLDPHTALVEYTRFSRRPLAVADYERALRHYTEEVRRLGEFEITGVEQGVIPMTDGRFPYRAGRSVFRIGTAGGATRPSTGYTFAAVQRQTAGLAAALRRPGAPLPPPVHSRWARALDAVLLRGLDSGRVDGAAFFSDLFGAVPTERLLRFLDGRSRLWEDLTIGLRTPVLPMLRTVAELPLLPRKSAPW